MAITDIRIKEVNSISKLKARASVTFDNAFVVHGFSIIDGKKGLFVGMPSVKGKDDYFDIAHPISKESRESICNLILEKYKQVDVKTNPFL